MDMKMKSIYNKLWGGLGVNEQILTPSFGKYGRLPFEKCNVDSGLNF
jgi:hypothetical protein